MSKDFMEVTAPSQAAPPPRPTRVNFVPGTIRPGILSQIVSQDPPVGAVLSASTVLNNGDQAVFAITTSQIDGARLLAVPDISFYVGSVAVANQLPGGAAIDESLWQVIGPWHDFAATDNNNVKVLTYIRNITAGAAQTVIIRARTRYIANVTTATGS